MQWLVFFRFWVGLGLGGVPVSFTLYMELMPTKGRGVWLIWLEVPQALLSSQGCMHTCLLCLIFMLCHLLHFLM